MIIEKIEVIGGSSALYGNNALGGLINVITKKPTDKPTVIFYGNYGGGQGIDYIQNYRLTHSYNRCFRLLFGCKLPKGCSFFME